MAMCATTCDDASVSIEIDRAANGLNLGKSLGIVINELSFLPQQTRKILEIGEKSGTLGQSLTRAERLLSKKLQTRIDAFIALLPQALALMAARRKGLCFNQRRKFRDADLGGRTRQLNRRRKSR